MSQYTLRVTQNGRVVGEFSLEDGELALEVRDDSSGRVVLQLQATAPGSALDELPIVKPMTRPEGDDLTMPLPETEDWKEESMPVDVSAELWTRSGGRWQQRGRINAGQKARYGDALVRLKKNGELVVIPGEGLSGGADLPNGMDMEILAGRKAHRFPPGSSVILTSPQGKGFYVKSQLGETGFRPIVEHSSDWAVESASYVPPSSDWS